MRMGQELTNQARGEINDTLCSLGMSIAAPGIPTLLTLVGYPQAAGVFIFLCCILPLPALLLAIKSCRHLNAEITVMRTCGQIVPQNIRAARMLGVISIVIGGLSCLAMTLLLAETILLYCLFANFNLG